MMMMMNMMVASEGSGTRNLGYGFRKCFREMGLKPVEQGFSSFFGKYVMIF